MNITELFKVWPERATVTVRLELRDESDVIPAGGGYYRLCLKKLSKVFELADKFGIQEGIRTNLNRCSATEVYLSNYILRFGKDSFKYWKSDQYGFILALATEFPDAVYLDSPEGEGLDRYAIDSLGNVTETIETDDGGC